MTKRSKWVAAALPLAVLLAFATAVWSESDAPESRSAIDHKTRRERLTHDNAPERELRELPPARSYSEAPAGFDNLTNGYLPQGQMPYESLSEDDVVPLRSFNDNRFIFEEVEHIGEGLGPT